MSSISSNNANIRKILEYNTRYPLGGYPDYFCECFQDKVIRVKQGYNDPTESNIIRVAHLLDRSTLGGRTTFGNPNIPPLIYLGGAEGQPGGLPRPPRNKF